jgi:3-phosphoshikimate 1-carboxyvinyltransferase
VIADDVGALVPASKSMTQRALVMAALAEGPTTIVAPLDCDDSRHLGGLLEALGCAVRWRGSDLDVEPPARLRADGRAIPCGNAGTAVRFGACLSLVCDGALTLDGDAHMRRRPIGPLADSLAALGVESRYGGRSGCPPVTLERRAPPPARVRVDASLSSQFASGLLLVAPRLEHGLEVELTGDAVSRPYVEMTLAMMRRLGARAAWQDERIVRVEPGGYGASDAPRTIAVEPDWSAGAFVLGAARLLGLDERACTAAMVPPAASLQGDSRFLDHMATLATPGAEPHAFDLTSTPDLIAPLAALCLFADRPARIRGAAHTRVKESDRIAVLCRELAKIGARVTEHPDGLDVAPLDARAAATEPVTLDPDDDHRMAMAFGLVSLRLPAVVVADPGCVSKSFPAFWRLLDTMRARAGAAPRVGGSKP